MRDNEIVAAIVASDLDGLAQAYDKYAAGLYGYCRSLLVNPGGHSVQVLLAAGLAVTR